MSEIKLITENTDISKLEMFKFDWDVVIGSFPYQVVRIPGYVHTIGGNRGENDLWMYPRDVKPDYRNLIQYNLDGCGVCWGIIYQPKNYVKTKWDENEGRTSGGALITRNGESFYFCPGGIIEAMNLLRVIPEHPANLNQIDFDKKLKGRKIWYRSQPAVIEKYLGGDDARIVIVPEDGNKFSVPNEFMDEPYIDDEYQDEIIDTIFSPHMWWFRE